MTKNQDTKNLWKSVTLQRKDTILSIAAIFGILGGILVFQSYAERSQDTTKPDTVIKLSKIDVNNKEQPYLYQFATKKDLTYCFKGQVTTGGSVGITVTYGDNVVNQIVTESKPTTEIGCFKASETSSNTTVTLDIDRDTTPKELYVY